MAFMNDDNKLCKLVNGEVTVVVFVVQLKNCNKEYCANGCRPANSPLLFLLTLSLSL